MKWLANMMKPGMKIGKKFNTELHRSETQRITAKPRLKELKEGHITCSRCSAEISITEATPLSLERCPECSSPNFIPMKLNKFWLYEPVGGGGMGSVYKAFHEDNTKCDFAVKILPRKKRHNKDLINSLVQETKIGRVICNHPHLTKVYEMGRYGNDYYAAYEFVDGIRLDRIIDSPVRRPQKDYILWALQILSAMQHIYECGYLYRDLKPQNVIITNDGNVKLVDYGLVLPAAKALENTGDDIQGSPFYIPPERISGDPESQYSDIYSLGMLLFHALSGTTYYSDGDIVDIVGKHVRSLRTNDVSSRLPANTNPKLVSVINKMIYRQPSRRYQSFRKTGKELFKVLKKCA